MDLHRLMAPSTSCRVSHQLCLTAFLQTNEPKHSSFHRLSDGQQAMVLQQCRLLTPEARRDVLALLLGQDDAVEALI